MTTGRSAFFVIVLLVALCGVANGSDLEAAALAPYFDVPVRDTAVP